MENKTTITKDAANKKMVVFRNFDAPVEQVWAAWTQKELLEQWWAPEPWKAHSKSMDFSEGGSWLYAMVGPDGNEHWAKVVYETIKPIDYFTAKDCFCDAEGNENRELPGMHWKNIFHKDGNATKVEVLITFPTQEALEKIVEMGFEEGFTMAHGNLDRLLQQMLN